MTLHEILAGNLAAARKLRQKSLSQFAEELAISRSSLQDMLKGEGNPTLSTVELVASRLGLDPLLLLSQSECGACAAFRLLRFFDWFRRLPAERQREFANATETILSTLEEWSNKGL